MSKDPLVLNSISDLNKLKNTTSEKLDLNLNPPSNKDTLSSVENIFIGGTLGGQMTKSLIQMAEKQLIDKYK